MGAGAALFDLPQCYVDPSHFAFRLTGFFALRGSYGPCTRWVRSIRACGIGPDCVHLLHERAGVHVTNATLSVNPECRVPRRGSPDSSGGRRPRTARRRHVGHLPPQRWRS